MTRMRQRRTIISLPSVVLSSPRHWRGRSDPAQPTGSPPYRARRTERSTRHRIHTYGKRRVFVHCFCGKEQARSVESVAAIQERSLESARHLRDPAQQCYLLIGLTDDAQVKSHLLDFGLALERQVGLIEGGTAGGAPPRLTAVTAPAAAPAQASPRAVARVPRAGAHTPREPPPPRDCRSIWQDASSAAPARAVPL